jgi:hypothetical protein
VEEDDLNMSLEASIAKAQVYNKLFPICFVVLLNGSEIMSRFKLPLIYCSALLPLIHREQGSNRELETLVLEKLFLFSGFRVGLFEICKRS